MTEPWRASGRHMVRRPQAKTLVPQYCFQEALAAPLHCSPGRVPYMQAFAACRSLMQKRKQAEWDNHGFQVIMLLKGNVKQVSFLHVYHHVSISCIWWAIAYAAPGGDGARRARAMHCVCCSVSDAHPAKHARMLCSRHHFQAYTALQGQCLRSRQTKPRHDCQPDDGRKRLMLPDPPVRQPGPARLAVADNRIHTFGAPRPQPGTACS